MVKKPRTMSLSFPRHSNVLVASWSVFAIMAATFTWYPLLPLYLKELGAHSRDVGLAYTLLGLSFFILQGIGGILSDRIGRKRMIVAPTFMAVPCLVVAAASRNWLVVTGCIVTVNLLSSLQWPSFLAMISESSEKESQGKGFAFLELTVALSSALGPGLGYILLPHLGVRWLILLSAATLAGCALWRKRCLKETLPSQIAAASSPEKLKGFQLTRDILWCLVSFSFFSTLLCCTYSGPFVALQAGEQMHFRQEQINLMFGLSGLVAVVLSPFMGAMVDRLGAKWIYGWACILTAVGLYFWHLSDGLVSPILLYILPQCGYQLCFVAHDTMLADVAPSRNKSLFIGLLVMAPGIIGSAGPILGMYASERLGSQAPFLCVLVLGILAFMTIVPLKKEVSEG
ncbi:MAG: MFS transporter [Armatimonadetes bacterium]|nr:MFS transporter [Armatimonadota bacterium]